MEYIYFNSRDELLRLRITEIAYFESDGNYCNVVTANKLRSPIGMNLTNLEHALDKQLGNEATTFIRIGKRFIVNKRYICKGKRVRDASIYASKKYRSSFYS